MLILVDNNLHGVSYTGILHKMEKITHVFTKYYQGIISYLPMRDVLFLAELEKYGLLPDHIRTALESLKTPEEMGSYVLDNVIKPELSKGSFEKFILVLIGSSDEELREMGLALNKGIGEIPTYMRIPSFFVFVL